MDALLASAPPLKAKRQKPLPRRAPQPHKTVDRGPDKEAIDPSTHSILSSTRLPRSFHHASLPTGSSDAAIRPDPSTARISDKKLRAKVARNDVSVKRARVERDEVNEWLNAPLAGGAGGIEVDEDEGERTWKVRQEEIVREVGVASGAKKFDLKLEGMGSYKVDYTRNGRHLAIASSRGHVATFDWQAGRLHSEIQLRETVRDIKFLHSEAFYAVAQKKYVFIYDQDGVEIHKLKQHIDVTHLEFLPYHYLLVSIGNAGYIKYHDTSIGTLLTQIPTHLGAPSSFAQNPHSAIIHAGHSNGTMTLWSPNLTTPHVKLLAHRGPVTAIAVDPSAASAGRYVATAGMDGTVKVWDARMWGTEVRGWRVRHTPTCLDYSGQGVLAVGGKGGVATYRDLYASSSAVKAESSSASASTSAWRSGSGLGSAKTPSSYLSLALPGLSASSARFCPFDDVLAVGHEKGISSLLVPGAGEPNFDSAEADVFETYSRRREREVRGVLEKIRPELITMDADFLGRVKESKGGETYAEREGRSYRQLGRLERLRADGKADEDEGAGTSRRGRDGEDGEGGEGEGEGEDGSGSAGEGGEGGGGGEKKRRKMRGKGGSMKRYLKKKNKRNVVDDSLLAMKAKVAKQWQQEETRRKIASGQLVHEGGALARFG